MTYEIALNLLTMEYKSAVAMETEFWEFWTVSAITEKRETVKKMMREVAEHFGKTYTDVLNDVRKNAR